MLAASLAEVDEAFLHSVCAEGRSESPTLDFKAQLPGKTDEDRREFLKDVSALANSDGGDIVYGIAENATGLADHIEPIITEPADLAGRRLRQVLEALEPRIPVQIRPIDVAGGYVLILRVPASFNGPHSARLPSQVARRFVMRNGTATTDMSYEQLRTAFERTATIQERAGQFRAERLERIGSSQNLTPVPLKEGPVLVLHLVPLAGLLRRQQLDVAAIFSRGQWTQLVPLSGLSLTHRSNLEGAVAYVPSTDSKHQAYGQLFRTGAFESALVCGHETPDAGPRLYNAHVARYCHDALVNGLAELRSNGFSGGAVVGVAVMRVNGYRLGREFTDFDDSGVASSVAGEHLVVPETYIERLEDAQPDEVLRPLLDMLWQAFDKPRCPYFDPGTGAYQPPR